MGSGEWGMGNGEWGVGSGEWGVGNGEWDKGQIINVRIITIILDVSQDSIITLSSHLSPFPIPYALCPMPYAPFANSHSPLPTPYSPLPIPSLFLRMNSARAKSWGVVTFRFVSSPSTICTDKPHFSNKAASSVTSQP